MASCKECVHVKVCQKMRIMNSAYDYAPKCNDYKGRSRFVELPCKVYTTFIGRVVEAKIYGYEASMKNSNCSWTIEPQHFGKYVFFTQEAAEQALKEREAT